MTEKLEVVASHQINCFGVNNENKEVFSKRTRHSNGVPVIINVYKDGSTMVCCQYFDLGDGKCECWSERSKQGDCPYKKEG